MNIFAETAPAYYAKGLPVIPLYSKEKRPVPTDWSSYHDRPVEDYLQQSWIKSCAVGNIGIVLGAQSRMCVLDIDTEDQAVIDLLTSLVPRSPWRRIGAKGMVLAFKYSGIRTFRIKTAQGESICELLSERTQVVLPPSIHPTTKLPYKANCDLLDVIDELPTLDPQIENILRGALKQHGVELSLAGSSKITDYVSTGSRDTSLTEKAGLFAFAVMRGERTLKEAIGMLRSYNTEFVEKVAGDPVDVEKHVNNLIRFLHRDVMDKGRHLPEGWDADLTEEEKEQWGLQFDKEHEEWTFQEMRNYLRDEFERHPKDSPGRTTAVEYILGRIARAQNLSSLDEGRLLQYIADISGLGIRVPLLKKRLMELRSSDIAGTDHAEIAAKVLEDMQQTHEIRRHGHFLWRYMGSHWEEIPDDEVMAKIAKDFGHLAASKRHSDHKGIFATLKNIAEIGIKTIDTTGINFANGFLDNQLNMQNHDSGYGMTYTLPFRYLPEQAGNAPRFFAFLEDCWGGDKDYQQKLDALQEALCATLFGLGTKLQRVILLKGVAKSGKSQLLKIAQCLVPEQATAFVPPNDWSDRFLPAELHEKLINVCGELSEKKKLDGQKFKDIVDGTKQNVQRKGQQPFDMVPICTHWFASNHSPKTDDTSSGFNRRWLILEFEHPVDPKKRQLDIGDTIVAEEREAIVAWAVLALPRLLENNEYTLPESHKEAIGDMANENNSVRYFMSESPVVQVVPEGSSKSGSTRISSAKLWKEYWSFCYTVGAAKPVSHQAFKRMMRELQHDFGFKQETIRDASGNQEVWYHSITLVDKKAA